MLPDAAWIEAVGIAAGCLTTLAYLPQVIQVWRSRSARDVSLGMFVLMVAGLVLWLGYGLLIGSVSLILANAVTLLLAGLVLIGKLRFDKPG
ncbi:SemiSWEET family sugar transporter [Ferrovibrio sp.]|uniref:SemiSWEET family sugar transporter n=1 Tax=Ferrovibrio sp. TaxID=1917215 RepID=UPI001B3CF6D7|nr:SemiSWEET transporter [Ferrovibrio sp.]MBP7064462.1 SemiSWEET family sugar transporter [Ferrovibrio sp.]